VELRPHLRGCRKAARPCLTAASKPTYRRIVGTCEWLSIHGTARRG
jgi:hypothetical protein